MTLHRAEQVLAAVTALTAVRAAYFVENWAGALGALPQGVLPTFVPQGLAYPMVSTRDIGRTAAGALVEGPRGRRVIELSGPRNLDARDVAAALATITGAAVAAVDAPLDAVIPTFTGFGMSPAMAALYRELYAGIASGRVVWEGGVAAAVRGNVPVEDTLRALVK